MAISLPQHGNYTITLNTFIRMINASLCFTIYSNGAVSLNVDYYAFLDDDIEQPTFNIFVGLINDDVLEDKFIKQISFNGSNFMSDIPEWNKKSVRDFLTLVVNHFEHNIHTF